MRNMYIFLFLDAPVLANAPGIMRRKHRVGPWQQVAALDAAFRRHMNLEILNLDTTRSQDFMVLKCCLLVKAFIYVFKISTSSKLGILKIQDSRFQDFETLNTCVFS